MIVVSGKPLEPEPLDALAQAFFTNFVIRQCVHVYGVPVGQVTEALKQHCLYDLACVRYRTWLSLRRQGVTLDDVAKAVTTENAPDVFRGVWTERVGVIPGVGPGAIAIINENRRKAGMVPL
jgi:hypothetical protein